jgi:hypothetical protein
MFAAMKSMPSRRIHFRSRSLPSSAVLRSDSRRACRILERALAVTT